MIESEVGREESAEISWNKWNRWHFALSTPRQPQNCIWWWFFLLSPSLLCLAVLGSIWNHNNFSFSPFLRLFLCCCRWCLAADTEQRLCITINYPSTPHTNRMAWLQAIKSLERSRKSKDENSTNQKIKFVSMKNWNWYAYHSLLTLKWALFTMIFGHTIPCQSMGEKYKKYIMWKSFFSELNIKHKNYSLNLSLNILQSN